MLQQTQVKTVIPYFNKFTKKFKDLKSFSKSSEKKVLKLWPPLAWAEMSDWIPLGRECDRYTGSDSFTEQ